MPEFPSIPYAGPANARYGFFNKRYMVIHCTSNTASPSAECAYARRRTDGVGLHFASDPSIVLQGLESWYGTGHVGSTQGNQFGIAWEFTGLTSWPTDYWERCIRRAALSMRLVMDKWSIPVRWLTDSQLRAGNVKGLVTHAQCSRVLGGSNHTDPGPNFPSQYLINTLNGVFNVTEPFDPWKDETLRTAAQRIDALRSMMRRYVVNYVDENKPEHNIEEQNELALFLDMINAKLDLLATKVDISPEELAAIEEAARQGGREGVSELTGDDVISRMKADPEFRALIVAAVNEAEDS